MAADLFRVVLPVRDLPRADAFYSDLLGLEPDRSVPGRHYLHTAGALLVLVDTAAHDAAHGHAPRTFEAQADQVYIRVPDLDATFERARALGCRGEALEGEGIRERVWGDRSFYTRDPSGNPLCFVDDAHERPTGPVARYCGHPIANLFKVVLPAQSQGRADAFFEELLQVEVDRDVQSRHFLYLDSCILALVDTVEHDRGHGMSPRVFRPNPEEVYFGVADLEAAFERAQKLGVDTGPGIEVQPWGERSFYGRDPSGNPICLVDDRTLYRGTPPGA